MPGALLKLLVKDKLPHSRITEVVMSTFAHARPHNAMHSPSYFLERNISPPICNTGNSWGLGHGDETTSSWLCALPRDVAQNIKFMLLRQWHTSRDNFYQAFSVIRTASDDSCGGGMNEARARGSNILPSRLYSCMQPRSPRSRCILHSAPPKWNCFLRL